MGHPFLVKVKGIQKEDIYEKSVFLELWKHTLIFCVAVIETHNPYILENEIKSEQTYFLAPLSNTNHPD